MIKSIRHKGLRQLWETGNGNKLPADQIAKIERILHVIDSAQKLPQDFDSFRNWNLHKLTGNLKGLWAVKVTGNYRIVFAFDGQDTYDIDYIDYHN